jgi:hypothetical protein
MCQWTGWKAVFSARPALVAARATMDTATEEWYFLCGQCCLTVTTFIHDSIIYIPTKSMQKKYINN